MTAHPQLNDMTPNSMEMNYQNIGLQENGTKGGTLCATNDLTVNVEVAGAQDAATTRNHRKTLLPQAHVERRPFVNTHFFKRPRLLQYYDHGALVDFSGQRYAPADRDKLLLSSTNSRRGGDGGAATARADPQEQQQGAEARKGPSKIQRDLLNLFIDLLWVGILSNVAEEFVRTAFKDGRGWGYAFLEYAVLFLASFRFWTYIRKFLNSFFNKDVIQSWFISWIMIVALFFGNQTAYFLDDNGGRIVIWTYLVARASFFWIEAFYSIFIPEIRREFFITSAIAFPVVALWAAAAAVTWPVRAALILPAIFLEGIVSAIVTLPIGKWFFAGAPRKALDPENLIDRLGGFFTIILGEGVYGLISGAAWGSGFSQQFLLESLALFLYYTIFWLYYFGDSTKTYIHATYRSLHTSLAFQFCHVILYGALLLLVGTISHIIKDSAVVDDTISPEEKALNNRLVRWTVSATLSITILSVTVKALLNRSLDPPGTMAIDNRWLRVAPRLLVILAIMLIPIAESLSSVAYMAILMSLVQPLLVWEYISGMEGGFHLFESEREMEEGRRARD